MSSEPPASATPKSVRLMAQSVGALAVLFLIVDGAMKLFKPIYVVEAFAREGIPIALAPAIGTLLVVLVAVYVIPRTRVIGAVLLTGYLGGAVSVNLRAGDPPFEVLFPIFVGCLLWVPLYVTNEKLRAAIGPSHSRQWIG